MIDLNNVAPIDPAFSLRSGTSDEPAEHRQPAAPTAPGPQPMKRRRFLQGTVMVALTTFVLGAFQGIAGANYTIRSDCYGVNYPNCGGCSSNRLIGGCCTQSGEYFYCNGAPYGYHKAGPYPYSLRPNKCGGSPYDGWYWKYSGCCYINGAMRKNAKWRCHDGYIYNTKSICRWRTSNGTTSGCPQ